MRLRCHPSFDVTATHLTISRPAMTSSIACCTRLSSWSLPAVVSLHTGKKSRGWPSAEQGRCEQTMFLIQPHDFISAIRNKADFEANAWREHVG